LGATADLRRREFGIDPQGDGAPYGPEKSTKFSGQMRKRNAGSRYLFPACDNEEILLERTEMARAALRPFARGNH